MSKSLGNVVCPFELIKKYGADAVRYFLLKEITPTEDGDFTEEKFGERYNSDLANGIGNTVNRVLTLYRKYYGNKKIKGGQMIPAIEDTIWQTINKDSIKDCTRNFYFHLALSQIIMGFKKIDETIEKHEPWKYKKEDAEMIKNEFYTWLESIRELTELLRPFLPEASERILKQLKSKKPEPIFPRIQ
jgi:methionyl-tRNA synthetase